MDPGSGFMNLIRPGFGFRFQDSLDQGSGFGVHEPDPVRRSSSKEGSYLRIVDFCITQRQAKSNKEEEQEPDPVDDFGSEEMRDSPLPTRSNPAPSAGVGAGLWPKVRCFTHRNPHVSLRYLLP